MKDVQGVKVITVTKNTDYMENNFGQVPSVENSWVKPFPSQKQIQLLLAQGGAASVVFPSHSQWRRQLQESNQQKHPLASNQSLQDPKIRV